MNFCVKFQLGNLHYFQNGSKMEMPMAFLMEISRFGIFLVRDSGFLFAYSMLYLVNNVSI